MRNMHAWLIGDIHDRPIYDITQCVKTVHAVVYACGISASSFIN